MAHGSTSPKDFDEMDPWETAELAKRIGKDREGAINLQVRLAQFVAQAGQVRAAQEVR
jgi:hypothetical protein